MELSKYPVSVSSGETMAGTIDTEDAGPKGQGTGTLGKAIATLALVAEAEQPLRFTDVLALSGEPRGTLHRQLSHLVEEGLLDLDRNQCYVPGLRLLKFASLAWARNEVRLLAEPHLKALHRLTGETVHFAVLRGAQVVYLDKVEGRQSVRMYSEVGKVSPVHCTGVGKAALSVLPDALLQERIAGLEFRVFTAQTHASAAALLAEIAAIRREGVAYDRQEHEEGIHCVAAPVRSDDKSLVAAISVTAPVYRISMQQLVDWAEPVRAAADSIGEALRFGLGPHAGASL